MAPTVCVAEFPMTGTTVNALIRRRRGPESSVKRRRFALEEMLRTGTIVKTLLPPREHSSWRLDYADMVPNYSVREAEESGVHSMNVDESYRKLVAERRKDLLSIVIRTIILVRRNRILQRRLNALRAETRRFLSSVLNNPENQQQRSQVQSHLEDSSFKVSTLLSHLFDIEPKKNSFHQVISNHDDRDHTDNESNSSYKSEDSNRSEY